MREACFLQFLKYLMDVTHFAIVRSHSIYSTFYIFLSTPSLMSRVWLWNIFTRNTLDARMMILSPRIPYTIACKHVHASLYTATHRRQCKRITNKKANYSILCRDEHSISTQIVEEKRERERENESYECVAHVRMFFIDFDNSSSRSDVSRRSCSL